MNQQDKKKSRLKQTVVPKNGKSKIHPAEALKREKNGLEVIDDIPHYVRNGWESIPPEKRDRLKWVGVFLPATDTGQV